MLCRVEILFETQYLFAGHLHHDGDNVLIMSEPRPYELTFSVRPLHHLFLPFLFLSLSLSPPFSTSLIHPGPHSRCLYHAHCSGNPFFIEAYYSGRSTRRELLDTIYEHLCAVLRAPSTSPFHFSKVINSFPDCNWGHILGYVKF